MTAWGRFELTLIVKDVFCVGKHAWEYAAQEETT